jgi:hypothetical protein
VLRFALGPIPVRIHWSALVLALFAWNAGFQGVEIAVFTGVALISVLIHELGHAIAARTFAGEAMVTLYALGGVTRMVPTKPFSNGQGFIISAAGSAVEIVAGMVVWLGARQGLLGAPAAVAADGSFGAMVGIAIGQADLLALGVAVFIWVSLVWGLFNWVPIRGLDGHNMLGRVLDATLPPKPSAVTLRVVSIVVGIGVAVWAWVSGQRFVALFVLLLTFSDVFPRAVGSVAGGR